MEGPCGNRSRGHFLNICWTNKTNYNRTELLGSFKADRALRSKFRHKEKAGFKRSSLPFCDSFVPEHFAEKRLRNFLVKFKIERS